MDKFYWTALALKAELDQIEEYAEKMKLHTYPGWEEDLKRDVEGLKRVAISDYSQKVAELKMQKDPFEVIHG
jgi:hypothetical protein